MKWSCVQHAETTFPNGVADVAELVRARPSSSELVRARLSLLKLARAGGDTTEPYLDCHKAWWKCFASI